MTARETCRADELTEDTYVVNGSVVQRIAKVLTVGGRTTVIDGHGDSWRVSSGAPINLATTEQAQTYEDADDRARVADGFRRLAQIIEERQLPVPSSLRDVKVDFTLHDSADLSGWAEVLRRRPVKHTPSLLPSMSSDELGLDVCIVGGTGEFGPELAERVEHRDAVGAFPVVAPDSDDANRAALVERLTEARDQLTETGDTKLFGIIRALETNLRHLDAKPERDGWSVSDGHRPQVDDEAMKHDRHSGEG